MGLQNGSSQEADGHHDEVAAKRERENRRRASTIATKQGNGQTDQRADGYHCSSQDMLLRCEDQTHCGHCYRESIHQYATHLGWALEVGSWELSEALAML
jgi:hypothetical protein